METTTKTIQQLRLEYLDEVANYYNTGNRSVSINGESCVYDDGKGHQCAIGRRLSPELRTKFDQRDSYFTVIHYIFNELPENLKIYGQEFLSILQSLHDRNANWNDKGLSEYGITKYKIIKETYCE